MNYVVLVDTMLDTEFTQPDHHVTILDASATPLRCHHSLHGCRHVAAKPDAIGE